ncbi:hypothetical protein BDE36_1776 [Arcticibacter tournemirensis]|uniref:Uncharacterized protein n=2 Tax=Arcticibacter tournemirensis TaxID=699437 RepID=A0A5M9HC12_9SPHI|nr:hypothetical protein F1649_07675 [Arcticibacter tournemirensis]TQM50041.1 hypothetical protein BDE36_1776 [Arcticibacter tournemirensis]
MLYQMSRRDHEGEYIPFTITFVTCNLKLNTGGEKITLEQAVYVGGPSKADKVRNPNHAANYTRNIRSIDGDRIIKIHPLLVTQFNGRKVAQ